MQVAFLAGLLYTAVGFLQLGWVTNFLSQSDIAGFMTGASVIIGLQQVGPSTGYRRQQSAAWRQAQSLLCHGLHQWAKAENRPELLHSAIMAPQLPAFASTAWHASCFCKPHMCVSCCCTTIARTAASPFAPAD